MLNAKLLVVGGDAQSGEFSLMLPTTIGRGRETSLTLPHPLVSRTHCEILERDGQLVVKDLGSLNGTFVNNQRIDGEQVLEPEQLLTLGNVTFRAIYEVGVELDPALENQAHPTADTGGVDLTELEPQPLLNRGSEESSQKETVYDESRTPADTEEDLCKVSELTELSEEAEVVLEKSKVSNRSPEHATLSAGVGIDSSAGREPNPSATPILPADETTLDPIVRKLPR